MFKWHGILHFCAMGSLLLLASIFLYKKSSSNRPPLLQLNPEKMPVHLAFVMDGNGRWALKKNRERVFGHKSAVSNVKEIVRECAALNIKYLTLYAFSTENWKRPQKEVDFLMKLITSVTSEEFEELIENNVKILFIGDLTRLPEACAKAISSAEDRSKNNTGMNLIIALSYGSRWELAEAVKKIIVDARSGAVSLEDVDENFLHKYLATSQIPDPDFLIRTGGEYRLSNFLLAQLAYTELYFTSVLWPDFTVKELHLALQAYEARDRRFGNVK